MEANAFKLTRSWFNFCFENPHKIRPEHTAIYCFAIEHCNRLGWKDSFGLPSAMAMEALGISRHQTYSKYFKDLCKWGFFKLVKKSNNQYSSNVISLGGPLPKTEKNLDTAIMDHRDRYAKKRQSTVGAPVKALSKQRNSSAHIIKPLKPLNHPTNGLGNFNSSSISSTDEKVIWPYD